MRIDCLVKDNRMICWWQTINVNHDSGDTLTANTKQRWRHFKTTPQRSSEQSALQSTVRRCRLVSYNPDVGHIIPSYGVCMRHIRVDIITSSLSNRTMQLQHEDGSRQRRQGWQRIIVVCCRSAVRDSDARPLTPRLPEDLLQVDRMLELQLLQGHQALRYLQFPTVVARQRHTILQTLSGLSTCYTRANCGEQSMVLFSSVRVCVSGVDPEAGQGANLTLDPPLVCLSAQKNWNETDKNWCSMMRARNDLILATLELDLWPRKPFSYFRLNKSPITWELFARLCDALLQNSDRFYQSNEGKQFTLTFDLWPWALNMIAAPGWGVLDRRSSILLCVNNCLLKVQ